MKELEINFHHNEDETPVALAFTLKVSRYSFEITMNCWRCRLARTPIRVKVTNDG
jgi:hypothetical protein